MQVNWHKQLTIILKTQFLLGFLMLSQYVLSDIINPTLVEITAYPNQTIKIELSLNIEAILSNSTRYKDSKNSPNSDRYDYFRQLTPQQVKQHFLNNLPTFLKQARLVPKRATKTLIMKLISLEVPDIGYQGRPRLSKLILTTQADTTQPMMWHYHIDYGGFVYRYRFYQQDSYTWSNWQWTQQSVASFSFHIPVQKSNIDTILDYISIGFLHILPKGLDHILFIIGIALLALSWQKLLTMVTLFTVAHSITLALAVYGIFSLSASIVEPLIALSIAYIGVENLRKPTYLYMRYGVIFIFGLLHGLGFASVLQSFETNTSNLIHSLIGFNIGVELGQVLIIGLVLSILWLVKYFKLNAKTYLIQPVAIFIIIIGLIWTVERLT